MALYSRSTAVLTEEDKEMAISSLNLFVRQGFAQTGISESSYHAATTKIH